jgi:hypothetical protein
MKTSVNTKIAASLFLFIAIPAAVSFSQEEAEYRRFNFDNVSCDAGVLYSPAPDGMTVSVSAIATGKGAEFRKWKVSGIKLNIGGERMRPERSERFYVKEESLFRIPAAVIFAALGTQIDVSGSSLEKGVAKVGMAAGLGLLVLASEGDIAGEKAVFKLDSEKTRAIETGKNFAEIYLEDDNVHPHLNHTVIVSLARPLTRKDAMAELNRMSQDELIGLVDSLEGEVTLLEKDQSSYKYGIDPQYDELQRSIENIQTRRGMAYRLWLERRKKGL